jgi:ribosomal protein S18 acetylase RimI-like enzyme
MLPEFIRRADPDEQNAVQALVQTVVDEIYGGLWAPPPLPVDQENWSRSWVAVVGNGIVGVVLTDGPWLSDLWVLREYRGRGIGHQLLAKGEAEMLERGHRVFRLRVAKRNSSAINFYHQRDWRVAREFPHEKFPLTMLEMAKTISLE